MAAMYQLGAVTWSLESFNARLAPSRLLAWPVMNIAQATTDPWYIAATRNAPSRRRV